MSNQISNGTIKISYKKYELFFMTIDIDHLIERFSDEDHLKSFQEIARVTKEARYIFKQNKVYLVVNTKENTTSVCYTSDKFIRIKTCFMNAKNKKEVENITKTGTNLKTNKAIGSSNIPSKSGIEWGQGFLDMFADGTLTEEMMLNPKKWKRVK